MVRRPCRGTSAHRRRQEPELGPDHRTGARRPPSPRARAHRHRSPARGGPRSALPGSQPGRRAPSPPQHHRRPEEDPPDAVAVSQLARERHHHDGDEEVAVDDQDAARSSVQSARSTTIAGRATAVIISSRPDRKAPIDDRQQERRQRVPSAASAAQRGCRDRPRAPLPACNRSPATLPAAQPRGCCHRIQGRRSHGGRDAPVQQEP